MRQKLVLLVVLLLSIVHVHSEEWIPAVNPLTSCNESYYQLDRALIRYQADPQQKLLLYAINNQCYKCIRSYVGSGTNDSNSCATLWTPHSWDLYLVDSSTDSIVAQVQYSFGEKGEYLLSPLPINRDITNADLVENDFSIEILETKKPVDGLFPLIIFIIVLIVIAILSFVLPFFYETFFSGSNDDSVDKSENGRAQVRIFSNPVETFEPLVANSTENYSRVPLLEEGGTMERNLSTVSGPTRTTSATPNNGVTGKNKQTSPVKKERLKSLDTFRGLSLLLMIFVNYGGGGYWFLDHSPWNGLTVADLLFPWFMWIMGVSMAMSFASQLPKGDFYHVGAGSIVVHRPSLMVPWVMWYRVCRRSFILFGLGMFLANGYEYTTWRVPGVLQYFAISYFITSATVLLFHETTQRRIHIVLDQEIQRNEYNKDSGCSVFDRILACRKSAILTAYCYEWIVQLAIIAIYIGIAYGVSAPGCPRGYIGPGGLGDDGEHPDCTGGIHRYIDMQIFGYKLIYHHPTCLNLYKCIAYDPEVCFCASFWFLLY